MRLVLINSCMDEMKKPDEVVRDGGTLKASTVSRVKVRLHYGEEPITKEGFVDFTKEGGARDVSQIVFGGWRMLLRDWSLVLYYPGARVFSSP